MSKFTLSYEEVLEDGGNTETMNVTSEFDTYTLDKVLEKMFWFLRAAGYDYIDSIKIERGKMKPIEFGL